jgi:hypothetical protein
MNSVAAIPARVSSSPAILTGALTWQVSAVVGWTFLATMFATGVLTAQMVSRSSILAAERVIQRGAFY